MTKPVWVTLVVAHVPKVPVKTNLGLADGGRPQGFAPTEFCFCSVIGVITSHRQRKRLQYTQVIF